MSGWVDEKVEGLVCGWIWTNVWVGGWLENGYMDGWVANGWKMVRLVDEWAGELEEADE